jgi:hypothetical protein
MRLVAVARDVAPPPSRHSPSPRASKPDMAAAMKEMAAVDSRRTAKAP